MLDRKLIELEVVSWDMYQALRRAIGKKNEFGTKHSKIQYAEIIEPLAFNSFEELYKSVVADAPIRRLSLPETQPDGSFRWKRASRQEDGKFNEIELEKHTAAAEKEGVIFVHYSAGRMEDHEICFERIEGKVVSLELRVPTRQLEAYTARGNFERKTYANAV